MGNPLTDPLQRWDPESQELAYNNFTDRIKVELPQAGDGAASGVVRITDSTGSANIPVYLSTKLDQSTDDVRVYNSSGGSTFSVNASSASGAASLDVHSVDIAHKESEPYGSGYYGVPAMAVRNDNIGSLVDRDRDLANLQLNAYGDLRTQIDMVRDQSIDIGYGWASGGTIRVAVASGVEVSQHINENTWPQLTAPGNTSSINVLGTSKHAFQYKIGSINTSVAVCAVGSLDNSNFYNLDPSGGTIRQTANGTYGLNYDLITKYVAFSFVSEAGGTAATIDVGYIGGN
jgi:hypothetical protein